MKRRPSSVFFECVEDQAVAAELLKAVQNFAVAQGMERIIGPVDFSTNYPCGVVIHGHALPPTVMTPYTRHYYPALLEACGYRKVMDFYAYTHYGDIPERLTRLRPLIEKRYPGLVVRSLRSNNIRRDMAALREVYDAAFMDTWGFVPMSGREFAEMQQGFLGLRCLNSVMLATVNSRPAGILIALPDINQTRQIAPPRPGRIDRIRLSVLGVKPEFRGKGIESMLILKLLDFSSRQGYREIDCSLILENNAAMNTFIHKEFGCPLTRTFRVYGQAAPLQAIGLS